MFAPTYLDWNATAPGIEAVRDAMVPWLTRHANASSRHEYGRAARAAIDHAREQVAYAVNAQPNEVIFTSGGSEANNLLLRGAAAFLPASVVAVTRIEHPCVLEPARLLTRYGWRVQEIDVDEQGRVREQAFHQLLAMKPALISVMAANNETGVLQDVALLAQTAQASTRSIFHCDAVQMFGKLPIDFRALNQRGVHAMTLSAHKIGGPQGVGALIVDKRIDLLPLISGGGQERGLRSGTENVAAIVGFGVAAQRLAVRTADVTERQLRWRNKLETQLAERGAVIFGGKAARLPNTSFFAFAGVDGETLTAKLDRAGFAVGTGSACSSAQFGLSRGSHVLAAMGVPTDLARGAVRVSIGPTTAEQALHGFMQALDATLVQMRALSALAA